MKNLIRLAINHPVTILMLTLGCCLLGIISYKGLSTELFPDIKSPALFISLYADGQPPEEIERNYVETVESLAGRLDGVKNIESRTSVGISSTKIEYHWKTDMDEAFLDLQRVVSPISRREGITSVEVSKYDLNASPILKIAVVNDEIPDMNLLRQGVEDFIKNELIRIEGIADVRLNGQEYSRIEVAADPYLMKAYGVTTGDIASAIASSGRNISGGNIVEKQIRYIIKGVSPIRKTDDISDIIVGFINKIPAGSEDKTPVKSPVYVKDVAKVTETNTEPGNITRISGRRCISMSVYKESGYNTVTASRNVKEMLERFSATMPNYRFTIIEDEGVFIDAAVGEVKRSALIGILLAVFVIYIFLKRWTNTLAVSIAIPVSVIATFNLMYFNGLSINIMSLGGLALGAGMLVDNAIVVMENIFRRFETGETAAKASVNGAAEVCAPIVSSTLTTIAVFLPIVYIEGAAGELFKEQAWTVTFSLVSSLFVALFLIPALTATFLKKRKNRDSLKFSNYGEMLRNLLKKPWRIIGIAAIVVSAAAICLPFIGTEFMPSDESSELVADIRMEEGKTVIATDNAVSAVLEIIREKGGEEIEWIFSHCGNDGEEATNGIFRESGENKASLKIKLKKGSKLGNSGLMEILGSVFAENSHAEISFRKETAGIQSVIGTDEAPVAVEVKGEEHEIIEKLCREIKYRMASVKGIYDIKTSMEAGSPQVDIKIDRLRSGASNVGTDAVISQIRDELNGKDAGKYNAGGRPSDINISLPKKDINELKNMEILSGDNVFRLEDIAEIRMTTSPRSIFRSNNIRTGKVTALLSESASLGKVSAAIKDAIGDMEFPPKYTAAITGEEAKRAEAFKGLNFALILSLVFVYMVMASQFESLRHPFTIMLSIPLAGAGTVAAFMIFSYNLNIMAFIGIIMLTGIAVNNAILLVDAINKEKSGAASVKEAVIRAAQRRIRPILMTTATTVMALLPMCISAGEGAALRSSMAIAVIGGLISATLLTLVVIPALYCVFEPERHRETPDKI